MVPVAVALGHQQGKAMSTRGNIRATNRGADQALAGAALILGGLLLLISP
jgi:hypothetical protein